MNLKPEHIESRKKVGTLDNDPIFQVVTTGGLHLMVLARKGKSEVLAAAPHAAIARHLAKKKATGTITWTELNKSDYVPEEFFRDILPRYEALTDIIRKRQGLE